MPESAGLVPFYEAAGIRPLERAFPGIVAFRKPPSLPGDAIRLADDKGGKLGPSLAALPTVHFLKGGAELADPKTLEGNPEPMEHF